MVDKAIQRLDRPAAWRRLASTNIGRLGVSISALPIVVPINYLVAADEALIFAVPSGSPVSMAIDGAVFAFEAGGVDAETERWWSVIARGRAHLIGTDHPSQRALEDLQLRSDVHQAVGTAQLLRGGEVPSSRDLPALTAFLSTEA